MMRDLATHVSPVAQLCRGVGRTFLVQRLLNGNLDRSMFWYSLVFVLMLAISVSAEELPRSDASDVPRAGVVRVALSPHEVHGRPLALVFYDLNHFSLAEIEY